MTVAARPVRLAYGRDGLTLDVPPWATVLTPTDLPGLADEAAQVAAAFDKALNPLPAGPVAVVFPDLTRPFPHHTVLPPLLEVLRARGAGPGRVRLLCATGTHRQATDAEMRALIGDTLVDAYGVHDHDATGRAAHVEVGRVDGAPVLLDRAYLACATRIYPLDRNLYQAVKGMTAAERIVRPGGTIVAAAACADGIPEEGDFGRLLAGAATPAELLDPPSGQDQWQVQVLGRILAKAPADARARRQRVRATGALAPLRPRTAAGPARRGRRADARLLGGAAPHRSRRRGGREREPGDARRHAVVYVAHVPSEHSMRMFTEVGRRVLPHCTGVGKALLSQLPDAAVRKILLHTGLPAQTERTITTPEALLDELERIRGHGYAVDDGEREPGVRCVAVPVIGGPAQVAVSVSGPSVRVTAERVADIAPLLQRVAGQLGADLRHPA